MLWEAAKLRYLLTHPVSISRYQWNFIFPFSLAHQWYRRRRRHRQKYCWLFAVGGDFCERIRLLAFALIAQQIELWKKVYSCKCYTLSSRLFAKSNGKQVVAANRSHFSSAWFGWWIHLWVYMYSFENFICIFCDDCKQLVNRVSSIDWCNRDKQVY